MLAWWTKRESWKIGLVAVFLMQAVLDAAFWLAWLVGPTASTGHDYVMYLNVLFFAGLIMLTWRGGAFVARDVLSRLFNSARLGDNLRVGSSL